MVAQKQTAASTVRVHGFYHGWPSTEHRESAIMTMVQELKLEARDVLDIAAEDGFGKLPGSVLLTLRSPGRRQRFCSLMFAEPYKHGGLVLKDDQNPENNLTLWISMLDPPIEKREQECKRAIAQVIHEQCNSGQTIKKSWSPIFKATVDGELVIVAELIKGRMCITVTKDWHDAIKTELLDVILKKSAPRHIKAACENGTSEEAKKIVDQLIAKYPYDCVIQQVEALQHIT